MNKILILTTEGCEACDIAQRNVDIATMQSTTEIQIEVKDYHEVDKRFIVDNKVKDFPTVFYLIDDVVIYKAVGTYPSAVYLRWMDIYFKN